MANTNELQKLFYSQLREQYNFSAQFAIRVISKVVEAYKHYKSIKPVLRAWSNAGIVIYLMPRI